MRGEGDEPFSSGGRGGLSGACNGDGCWEEDEEEGLPSLTPPRGRGRRVPQRPLTQGASSAEPRTRAAAPLLPLRTGDCERREGGSGPRGAGVALIGEGRELRLGLRGARPEGA